MNYGEIAGKLWELGYNSDNYFEIIEYFGYSEADALIICSRLERFEELWA